MSIIRETCSTHQTTCLRRTKIFGELDIQFIWRINLTDENCKLKNDNVQPLFLYTTLKNNTLVFI